ncbi:hypothetical protein ACK34J_09795 [Aeromonas veronii]
MEIFIEIPDDYPVQGILDIGAYLQQIDVLVPDYPDPDSEVYFVGHYLGVRQLEGTNTVLLPDRNVVSRMARVAKGEPLDVHGRNAAAILAFAQCLDIDIEPSIAFHEMAFNEGNQSALEELAWFRVADNGNPHEWVAVGLEQLDRIHTVGIPSTVEYMDLAKPLRRWRRNYIVALKMGELELNRELNAMQKVTALLEWMRDDFILAGPAAVLAFLYFAPNSPPRKGLLKSLKSADRLAALAGAKNAAWDITYLSDFARRITEENEVQQKRYIFATFDKRLRDLARLVIGENEEMGKDGGLEYSFARWWPTKDAKKIASLWSSCLARTRNQEWWAQYNNQPDYVDELIARGEYIILNWENSE